MNSDYIKALNSLKELCAAKKDAINYKNCSDEQASEWREWNMYIEFIDQQAALAAEGFETNWYGIYQIRQELEVDIEMPKLQLNKQELDEKEKPLMFF